MSEVIATLTDQNFEAEALGSKVPVLLDFWAEWCQPCLAMVPDLESVATQFQGRLKVAKVNVEENEHVPFNYNVTAMPTLILLKGGQVVEQRVGKLTREALTKLVEPHL
jgi:thioredoxin 1